MLAMKKAPVLISSVVFLIGSAVTSLSAQNGKALAAFGIERLAYETGPGSIFAPHEDIFVLDSSDSKPRRLATGIAAVWSPDGRKIAFCAHEGWGTPHITLGQMQLINADGSGHKQITNLPGGACPIEWSSDGKRISFSGEPGGVLLLGEDGESVTSILRKAGGLWSPDGTKLAFWRYRESRDGTGSIWVANADGSDARKVIDDNSEVQELSWSPDGETLLFSSEREHKNRSEIFRVKLDGSNLETVASDRRLAFFNPVISPDGKYLVVDAFEHGSNEGQIILIELTSRHRTVLAHGIHPHIIWQKRP